MSDSTWNPGFPVHVYQEGMELPKVGTYYLVAGNGFWLHKDTAIMRGFVPVDNISVLNDFNAEVEIEWKLPKLPARHVWRIKQFFKRVVEKYRAEAGTVLYYSLAKNDYKVHIPEQQVSYGGVRYKRVGISHLEDFHDYLRVGTIHSHCDFGAFHSGTDIGDEEDFDGLHVTFGHNHQDAFSISASVVMNGHRTTVDPVNVLEGITPLTGSDFYTLIDSAHDPVHHEWADGLDKWMSQVQCSYYSWGCYDCWRSEDRNKIKKGDKVVWAGNMSVNSLRTLMGDGPFEVLFAEQGKIGISTNVGLARFSEKLFKKQD
jgi:hypothetical protein